MPVCNFWQGNCKGLAGILSPDNWRISFMKTLVDRKPSSNSMLFAILVVPTVVIIAVGILLTLMLLRNSAARLDASEEDAERKLAQSVVATMETGLKKSLADYANWDEVYDTFAAAKPDPQWIKENLGAYATETFDLSSVLVITSNGTIKYNYAAPTESSGEINAVEQAQFAKAARFILQDWQRGVVKGFAGAASFRGKPHIVALAPITLNSEKRMNTGARPGNLLVFIRPMNGAVLGRLAQDFGLVGLHVVSRNDGMVPLTSPLGAPAGYSLAWLKSGAGSAFFNEAIPSILFVGMAVMAMLVVLGCGWALLIERIRSSEIRAIKAEDTSHAKSMFIANMSHELRTPLNAIIGFSELISKEIFGQVSVPKYREYASDIFASGSHLLGVVNNLLLFSKMEAKQHRISVEPLGLDEEVSDVVRVMQVEAQKRGIRLTREAISQEVLVCADRQSLRQILFNVLGNALKFSGEGTEVRVAAIATREDGQIELRIVDQGCGIPENTLRELGKAFVQAENAYSRKFQGTGLGLAICFGLAEQMGGSVKVASTEDQGTTVTVLLRRFLPDSAETSDVAGTTQHRSGNEQAVA